MTTTYRTHAAFVVSGRWVWRTFDSRHGSKHTAIIEHAAVIGATGWDTGNADHDLVGESRW